MAIRRVRSADDPCPPATAASWSSSVMSMLSTVTVMQASRFQRQAKVVLDHGVESRRLFRFAVRVCERFFDKLIEPRLAQARPPFARRDLSLAISVHAASFMIDGWVCEYTDRLAPVLTKSPQPHVNSPPTIEYVFRDGNDKLIE